MELNIGDEVSVEIDGVTHYAGKIASFSEDRKFAYTDDGSKFSRLTLKDGVQVYRVAGSAGWFLRKVKP